MTAPLPGPVLIYGAGAVGQFIGGKHLGWHLRGPVESGGIGRSQKRDEG